MERYNNACTDTLKLVNGLLHLRGPLKHLYHEGTVLCNVLKLGDV
jgi:hypothetical protein